MLLPESTAQEKKLGTAIKIAQAFQDERPLHQTESIAVQERDTRPFHCSSYSSAVHNTKTKQRVIIPESLVMQKGG